MRKNSPPDSYILFCCLLLYTSISTYGQNKSSSLQLKDSTAIFDQLRHSESLSRRKKDSALLLANQALESSNALQFRKGIAAALDMQGDIYQNNSEFQLSTTLYRSALPYCENNIDGMERTADIYMGIGDNFWYTNQADSAASYYYKALDEINAAAITKPSLLLMVYSKLILLWTNMNDTYSTATGPPDKYIESAISYFNKAAQHQDQDERFKANVWMNEGHIKRMLKQYDSARYFYQAALHLVFKDHNAPINPSGAIAATLLNMSESFLEERKTDSSIVYARLVIGKIRASKSKALLFYLVAHYFIGKAYYLQNRYEEAINILTTALKESQQNNIGYARHIAYETLAKAYAATGQYYKAWEAQSTFTNLSDSLKRSGSIQAISQMELRYRMVENKKELAEKELVIIRRDNSLKNQRLLTTAISVGAVLILLIGFLLYRYQTNKQRTRLLQVEQQMEISHLNAMIQGEEKERRRLATELHDGIGGLLGSIRLQLSSAIKTYKTEDRSEDFSHILTLLESTYADLRKTAHNLMPETLQQEGLEKATRLFCRSLATNGGTEILFEAVGTMPALPPHAELSLYRIIQELVHNIIKHSDAQKALVQLAFMENRVALTVEDDGKGFIPDNIITGNESQGMGLFTIHNRVKLMGGQMDISSSPGKGTSIYIEITIGKAEHNTIAS